MKRYLKNGSLLLTFISFYNIATAQNITLSSYSNQTEIKASGSITLTNGFIIPSGKNVHIFIEPTFKACTTLVSTPSSNQNYILTRTFKVAGISTLNIDDSRSICEENQVVKYYDGLGRPVQSVIVQGSTSFADVVQPTSYDAFGRENKKYLSYTVSGGNGVYQTNALQSGYGLDAFYNSAPAGVKGTVYPFSQTVFESSPLNRVIEMGGFGAVWQPYSGSITGSGHTKKIDIGTNVASEVHIWQVTSTGAETVADYTQNTLTKTIIKDENWVSGKAGTTEEFKDKDGNVVLKRMWESGSTALDTYYVYDDYGNLRYVIPPGVSDTDFEESDDVFKDFIYGYHYDGLNRIIEKKTPGKGWEYMVYNKLNQLVLSQDANLRTINRWFFNKYDSLGRTIITGIISSSASRSTWQTDINAASVLMEGRDVSDVSGTGTGYTNNVLPAHSSVFYYNIINYYDDYTFNGNPAFNPSTTRSSKTKGLLTGSSVNIVNTVGRLLTVQYYDDEGRVVEVISDNNLGGTDRVINTWNFANELTATDRTHIANSATTTIANRYEYDHMGRKLASMENINGQGEVVLSKLVYNEIGQLTQKYLHSTDGSTFLQNTKFAYNEQGWLKESNAAEFKMKLGYDTTANPQYNGNISTQLWGSSYGNKFTYTYDNLNRLTNGTSTGKTMSEALTYDAMGNIATMNRDAAGVSTYSYNGNQLNSISGSSITMSGSYAYDGNGNATTDGRNGVTLTYNFLNLPVTAAKYSLSLTYTYTATGTKLKKVNSTTSTTTDYVDGIQYTNGSIDFIQTEEGRALNNAGTYTYQYNLTDHLGNVRYSFDIYTGAVRKLQEDNYYPFGKEKSAAAGTNKYLYNGKELQDELGQYDYGARFYDAEIGRFNSIDPLSEVARRWSPYSYGMNNPIRFIDVDGMYVDDYVFNEEGNYVRTDKNNKPDKLVVENSQTGNKKSYEFNDPENDVKAIKNSIASDGKVGINKVTILSDAELEKQINKSGVKDAEAQESPLSYAKSQGDKKMDYGVNGIISGDLDPKSFYIREGTAYNVGDIGNYMWGRGMAELGIELPIAKAGAHYNNMRNGRRQGTSLYDFGPGTYGSPGILDSPGDQRAIQNGHTHSSAGIRLINKAFDRMMNPLIIRPKY